MDELKVTKDLREEVLKHCDSFDYCGRNLAYFSSKNKRNITFAIAAVLKANDGSIYTSWIYRRIISAFFI